MHEFSYSHVLATSACSVSGICVRPLRAKCERVQPVRANPIERLLVTFVDCSLR
jgi:hypothetical protein